MLPPAVHAALDAFRPDTIAAIAVQCTTPDALNDAIRTGLVARARLQAAVEHAVRTNALSPDAWCADPLWSPAEAARQREDTAADWTTPRTAAGAMIIAHRVSDRAYRLGLLALARRTPSWSAWFGFLLRAHATPAEQAEIAAASPVVAAGLQADRATQLTVVAAPVPPVVVAPRAPAKTRA